MPVYTLIFSHKMFIASVHVGTSGMSKQCYFPGVGKYMVRLQSHTMHKADSSHSASRGDVIGSSSPNYA